MAALGPLLGWKGVLLTLAGGSVVGTVLCVILLSLRKIHREDAIPFGPFLTVAAWLLWMNPRWLSVF